MENHADTTPGQASAAGTLLEIDHPHGGPRYMAHVFDLTGGGIAWVDSGWTDPLASGHVCHFIQGLVAPQGDGWQVRSEKGHVIPLRPARRDGKPDGEREKARQALRQSFDLDGLLP